MNGRVAKRLRREAERATAGLPERRYERHSPIRLHPHCTRAVYRGLKAEFRRWRRA
jgi:hypothetical protein